MDGYEVRFKEKSLLTIWSAPNYRSRHGNSAAILSIDEELNRELKIFKASPESMNVVHYNSVFPSFA